MEFDALCASISEQFKYPGGYDKWDKSETSTLLKGDTSKSSQNSISQKGKMESETENPGNEKGSPSDTFSGFAFADVSPFSFENVCASSADSVNSLNADKYVKSIVGFFRYGGNGGNGTMRQVHEALKKGASIEKSTLGVNRVEQGNIIGDSNETKLESEKTSASLKRKNSPKRARSVEKPPKGKSSTAPKGAPSALAKPKQKRSKQTDKDTHLVAKTNAAGVKRKSNEKDCLNNVSKTAKRGQGAIAKDGPQITSKPTNAKRSPKGSSSGKKL